MNKINKNLKRKLKKTNNKIQIKKMMLIKMMMGIIIIKMMMMMRIKKIIFIKMRDKTKTSL